MNDCYPEHGLFGDVSQPVVEVKCSANKKGWKSLRFFRRFEASFFNP